MEQVFIYVKNVSKSYNTEAMLVPVLKGVDFHLKKSDFAVIIGPSGCGKSTLLHIMLGLEKPDQGDVFLRSEWLFDKDDNYLNQYRKRHIGMVYQQPNWVKSLSVIENVALPSIMKGHRRKEANSLATEVLEKMNMLDWQDYSPLNLSSGQQQKVALARAMINNPDIIIADEPTGNLDQESGQEVIDILLELQKEGKTVIMVTHNLTYTQYANRCLRMLDGVIIEDNENK